MKKEDLKTGMVVETRDGKRYVVFCENYVLVSIYEYCNLNYYNNDLKCKLYNEADIVKVFTQDTNFIFSDLDDFINLKLVWERKEPPQLTKRERAYLKAYSYDYEWIARDDDDCLTFFKEKPVKTTNGWYIDNIFNTDNLCKKDLFSFIKWEDEEPYRIKDLLGDKE